MNDLEKALEVTKERYERTIDQILEENKKLQQRLKEAENVLKMYASRNNWNSSKEAVMLLEDIGGETAREYLKKWERE